MLTFGSKINRSYSMYFPFMGDHTHITVYFSKSNTFIGFSTDSKIQGLCKEQVVNVNTYKDLRNSLFSKTFLDVKDLKTDNLDIRSQFSNILKEYGDTIQYTFNESIKLSKVNTENGPFDNLLFLYGFTFTNYQDDFIYILAERQHIDTIINKKLVRTSAIQISTKECFDNMIRMSEQIEDIPAQTKQNNNINDLFPDRENIKVNKL